MNFFLKIAKFCDSEARKTAYVYGELTADYDQDAYYIRNSAESIVLSNIYHAEKGRGKMTRIINMLRALHPTKTIVLESVCNDRLKAKIEREGWHKDSENTYSLAPR